jgi:hypothetical protein
MTFERSFEGQGENEEEQEAVNLHSKKRSGSGGKFPLTRSSFQTKCTIGKSVRLEREFGMAGSPICFPTLLCGNRKP